MLYASGMIVIEHFMVRLWYSRKSTGPGRWRAWFKFQLFFFASFVNLCKQFNSLKLQVIYNNSSTYYWNSYVYVKTKWGSLCENLLKLLSVILLSLLYIRICDCYCFSWASSVTLYALSQLIFKKAIFSRHC